MGRETKAYSRALTCPRPNNIPVSELPPAPHTLCSVHATLPSPKAFAAISKLPFVQMLPVHIPQACSLGLWGQFSYKTHPTLARAQTWLAMSDETLMSITCPCDMEKDAKCRSVPTPPRDWSHWYWWEPS